MPTSATQPRHGAYLRLTPDGFDPQAVATAAGRSLTFVDLGDDGIRGLARAEDALTDVAPSLVHLDTLVFRWPSVDVDADGTAQAAADRTVLEWLERLRERRLQMFESPTIGAIRFRIGSAPKVLALTGRHDLARPSSAAVLSQCRDAELRALLAVGDAVWRPEGYHFRLPGGQHAATFVRMADAIRSPRDAAVLATWLAGDLTEHGGVLADSPTITPIVTELRSFAARSDFDLGPVVFLQDYPRTRLGVIEAARRSVGLAGCVQGLLSVNSSGRVLDLMSESLDTVAPTAWTLDVMVDKRRSQVRTPSADRVRFWVGLDDELAAEASTSCPLCRDHARARVVFLDPRSFEPFLLPNPVLQAPDEADAYRNRGLFRLVADAQGLAVECLPSSAISPRGRRERMGVRFLHGALTKDIGDFEAVVSERASVILNAQVGEDEPLGSVLRTMTGADLVVVSAEDMRRGHDPDGNRQVVKTILGALGIPPGHILPIDTRSPNEGLTSESVRALRDSARPVVLALGSVTGWTLRRLRDTVRQVGGPGSRPNGLVVHSRPQSIREWEAVKAMFDGRCAYVWQTFLPWESPLRHEASLLSEFLQHLANTGRVIADDAFAFAHERQSVADPSDQVADWATRLARYEEGDTGLHPAAVFWAPQDLPRHRSDRGPFGRQLDHVSTYVAVAAALHRTRVAGETREGPFWRAFSINEAVRRRYDGVTLAAMLRWLGASEAWWGDTAADAKETAYLVRSFMGDTPDEFEVFLPEVLLATAMGKVHPAAAISFAEWAQELRDDPRLGASIGLGLELIQWARPTGVV
jgi:hypothetical protein